MVAMAIMVASFRVSVDDWLSHLLPADLYVRVGGQRRHRRPCAEPSRARLPPSPASRAPTSCAPSQLTLDPARPPVALLARDDRRRRSGRTLPLTGATLPPRAGAGETPVWVSEAMVDLYGYRVGKRVEPAARRRRAEFFVAGVWRDYARQIGRDRRCGSPTTAR